ncbi:MAG TPA: zf-HC2 domain-containing protein [Gemmatimonadales bacterium]|jgi:anti-sigma factor RsiW|nr:zf-HC2 domain-containing protein [Gemmatimonadales bacterium]
MTHPSPEQLSLLIDGELEPGETGIVESHLAGCAECAALLTQLRRVVARAQSLEDRPLRADLWPGVAAAIGATPSPRRRISLSIPQLLAAGIVIMLLSGGAVASLLWRQAPRLTQASAGGAEPSVVPSEATPVADRPARRGYEAAVSELQAELEAGRGKLDTATVRVVEEKLKLVDRAIGEAERALAADPANSYLRAHLTQTRLRKLDLLRRAAALTRAVS